MMQGVGGRVPALVRRKPRVDAQAIPLIHETELVMITNVAPVTVIDTTQ
jgi:hypothetical protein